MKLIVLGSSNMDLVISVPRIPAVGETILGGTFSTVFGGKGANQAIAAVRAGGDVNFISKLGIDAYGKEMKAHFIQEGLPNAFLLEDPSASSGIAQIWVSEKGENAIVVAPGANMNLSPTDVIQFKTDIANADLVLTQLEIPMSSILEASRIASKNKVRFILNPAPAQELPLELLKNTWLITPNETEAESLTGIAISNPSTATLAAQKLIEKGVQHVIITLGEKGCLYATQHYSELFPAFQEKAVDTTAAGDVFNGALAVALLSDKSIPESILFANAAAAISVTRKGAQSSIPTRVEIEKYLAKKSLMN